MRAKYPRTEYIHDTLSQIEFRGKIVVITEKMDGECTTMTREYIHARSVDSSSHPSQDWVRNFWSLQRLGIPEGVRLIGENMYAKHTIYYQNLESYFLLFNMIQSGYCYPWKKIVNFAKKMHYSMPKTLYYGPFYPDIFKDTVQYMDENSEGFVIRNVEKFPVSEFNSNIQKYVKPNFIQTNKHWKTQLIIPNQLKS